MARLVVRYARLGKGLLKMDLSIANMAVDLQLARTQQEWGLAVLKSAMESETEMAEETLQLAENLHPALGHNVDVRA